MSQTQSLHRFRLRWAKRGGHIHVRVFQRRLPGETWELNGVLVFDTGGWASFIRLVDASVERVAEDE